MENEQLKDAAIKIYQAYESCLKDLLGLLKVFPVFVIVHICLGDWWWKLARDPRFTWFTLPGNPLVALWIAEASDLTVERECNFTVSWHGSFFKQFQHKSWWNWQQTQDTTGKQIILLGKTLLHNYLVVRGNRKQNNWDWQGELEYICQSPSDLVQLGWSSASVALGRRLSLQIRLLNFRLSGGLLGHVQWDLVWLDWSRCRHLVKLQLLNSLPKDELTSKSALALQVGCRIWLFFLLMDQTTKSSCFCVAWSIHHPPKHSNEDRYDSYDASLRSCEAQGFEVPRSGDYTLDLFGTEGLRGTKRRGAEGL